MPQFRGDIMQLPPMYSAVSKDGVRLYELARKGLVTEREARPITVYKLDLLNFDEQLQSAQILVKCSKGTYIRSICDDIGQVLGCGAVMTSLRRVTACGYTLDDAITLEKAKELSENGMLEEYLRPTESVFACYPSVKVTEAQAVRFKNGGGLMLSRTDVDDNSENGAYYRVYNSSDVFLGLGYVNKEKEELSVKKQF